MESGFEILKGGKAIHQPMRLPDKGETLTGLGIRNKVIPGRTRTTESEPIRPIAKSPRERYNLPPPSDDGPPVNLSSKPSNSRIGGTSPYLSPTSTLDARERRSSYGSNTTSTTNGHDDYFGSRSRLSSTTSPAMSPVIAAAAAKKKPPPPPPPKKIGSFHGEYVTAMYDFDAHSAGDLSFREGDRIRVVKKTNSSQDWWEGELRGQKGSFPANYVR